MEYFSLGSQKIGKLLASENHLNCQIDVKCIASWFKLTAWVFSEKLIAARGVWENPSPSRILFCMWKIDSHGFSILVTKLLPLMATCLGMQADQNWAHAGKVSGYTVLLKMPLDCSVIISFGVYYLYSTGQHARGLTKYIRYYICAT